MPGAFNAAGVLHGAPPSRGRSERPGLTRRAFRTDVHPSPHGSADALAHIRRHGAPDVVCVWGPGVDEALLDARAANVSINTPTDADPIRVPPKVSRHFDLFLTGAEWQSDAIRARHPTARCAVLPIGPEFASDATFRPTGAAKDYDVVYVAATQPCKRHDLLLETLARLPHLRALCVVGYRHLTDALRDDARARGLSVDWICPLDHDGVNGAPAILTEYMLAGLPVLANAGLRCWLDYVRPDTGVAAAEDRFAEALVDLLDRADAFDTRAAVQARWTWLHSVRCLGARLDEVRAAPRQRMTA